MSATLVKTIPFAKMQGLGNDFVLVEAKDIQDVAQQQLERLAAKISDRHFGIGSDGLIVVASPSNSQDADIQFIFYNSDGSRAEMCGNGIRCFARYVRDRNLITKDTFTVETLAGLMRPTLNPDDTVTVDMGPPILAPAKIPFELDHHVPNIQGFPLDIQGRILPITLVSMGNPHCVIFEDEADSPINYAEIGPAIEHHPYFPAKTNVEFVKVIDRNHLDVTVWERGCGFTLACGTGACASAVAAILNKRTDTNVDVHLPGGTLNIRWDYENFGPVYMTGPAEYVFEGRFALPSSL